MKLRALAVVVAIAVGTLLAAIAAGGAPAAAAAPGTYTITTCSPGTSAGAWQSVNPVPAAMTAGNLCGNGTPAIGPPDTGSITDTGALFGEDIIGSDTFVPNGDQAGWQLTPPTGVTITSISYYGSFETSVSSGGWLAGLLINGQPLGAPGISCVTGLNTADCDCRTNLDDTSPCQVLNDQVPQIENNLNATSLFFGVECLQIQNAPTCAAASSGSHGAEADLYSAQVTLVESAQPQVQDEVGGLWGSGPVWGTVPLTFSATDPSGIARVDALDSSGDDVDDVQESCTYAAVQACPELPSGELQVNTLEIPDGQQQISLKLTNAAANTTVVRGPTVVIDNNGPPAPSSLTAVAANTTSDAIDLSWSDPATPPEPVQDADAQLCQTACQNPVQISTSGGAQITAPAAGTYTVRVWLTDSAGRGSAAQAATTSVTVPAQTTTPSSTTTTTTSSTTSSPPPPCKPESKCPVIKVKSATWANGRLSLTIARLPKHDRLQITIIYAHKPKRTVTTTKSKLTVTTARPRRLVLRTFDGERQQGATVTVTKLARNGRG